MKLALTLVVLALSACGSAKQRTDDSSSSASGPVTLSLDWPSNSTGTMKLYGATEKDAAITELHVTYTLTTAPADGGVAVKYSDARDIEVPNMPEPQRKMLVPMVQAVPTVVLRDGTVAAIDGFEEFQTLLNELLAPAYAELPGLQEQMSGMLTPDFFLASAQQEWAWRATAWHGRTLEQGQPISEEAEVPLVFMPGTVKGVVTMTLLGTVPCPNAAAGQCVRLERKLVIDQAAMQTALADTLGQSVDSFAAERSIVAELIAEPSTLRPHRFSKIESTSFQAKRGEEVTTVNERKQTLEEYTWN